MMTRVIKGITIRFTFINLPAITYTPTLCLWFNSTRVSKGKQGIFSPPKNLLKFSIFDPTCHIFTIVHIWIFFVSF